MNKKEIECQIRKKKSFLSIGLDSDMNKIPDFLKKKENFIHLLSRLTQALSKKGFMKFITNSVEILRAKLQFFYMEDLAEELENCREDFSIQKNIE